MCKYKKNLKNFIIDIIIFAIAGLLMGIGTVCFSAPNKIVPGGFTGVATLLNHLFGWSIGAMILILNIPLFVWAAIEFKGNWRNFFKFISKTFVAIAMMSIEIKFMEDLVYKYAQKGINLKYTEDILVAALVGGVLGGVGLALVFIRDGTTGGADLIAKLTNLHLKQMSIGNLLLIVDLAVVLLSAAVYKEISSTVYTIVMIFILTKIVDMMLYRVSPTSGKVMFIVSDKSIDIAKEMMKSFKRGITLLESHGGYSSKESKVLLYAVRRNEVSRTYEIIHRIDASAFVIVAEAGGITGAGFGKHF